MVLFGTDTRVMLASWLRRSKVMGKGGFLRNMLPSAWITFVMPLHLFEDFTCYKTGNLELNAEGICKLQIERLKIPQYKNADSLDPLQLVATKLFAKTIVSILPIIKPKYVLSA